MKARTGIGVLGLAAAAGLAIMACTGGTAGEPTFVDVTDNHPGGFESPGSTRESPNGATTGEQPNGGDGTSQSGGSSGGATTCPPCPGTFLCANSPVTLSSGANGECTTATDSGTLTLTCDGKIEVNGQAVGTWSKVGDSIFVSEPDFTGLCSKSNGSTPPPPTPTLDASVPGIPDAG